MITSVRFRPAALLLQHDDEDSVGELRRGERLHAHQVLPRSEGDADRVGQDVELLLQALSLQRQTRYVWFSAARLLHSLSMVLGQVNEEPCKIRHQWQHLTHNVLTTCIVTRML